MPVTFNARIMMIGFATAFVFALAATLALRALMARRVWHAGASMQLAQVSAYQMALLSGGVSRVALTGVVRLLGRNLLHAGVAGVLVQASESHEALDMIERDVLDVAKQPRVFRDLVLQVEYRLKQGDSLRQLRGELVAMGYMRAPGSKAWWTHYVCNMLPFALLSVIVSAVFATSGLPAVTPGWLIGFGACSAAAMLIVALPRRVTALGRYIVWSATQHHPDLRSARATQGDALAIKALGQSVALYGPGALTGSDLGWIPAILASTRHVD